LKNARKRRALAQSRCIFVDHLQKSRPSCAAL
jgi:hypothetical protein